MVHVHPSSISPEISMEGINKLHCRRIKNYSGKNQFMIHELSSNIFATVSEITKRNPCLQGLT